MNRREVATIEEAGFLPRFFVVCILPRKGPPADRAGVAGGIFEPENQAASAAFGSAIS
jgi:hypothetical protein